MTLKTEYNVGNTFAFVLIKRDVYLSVGGLNEIYKKCFEDVEFCISCTTKKLKHKFVGDTACYHIESVSRNKLSSTMDEFDLHHMKQKLRELYEGKSEKLYDNC